MRLRSFCTSIAAELTTWLVPRAIEDERFIHLARLVLEECRHRRFTLPSPAALERLCVEVRHKARTEIHRRLTNGLSAEQRKGLDVLTGRREPSGQSWLTWLQQMPEAAKPTAMLAHLSPLGWEHVNLTGDYVWGGLQQGLSENTVGLRPLRTMPEVSRKAA